MILLCNNDLCQFSGRCPIPSQNRRKTVAKYLFLWHFRVKIGVCQLIPSQEKFGVLNGALVRIALLMFIV